MKLRITVEGKSYEVDVEVLEESSPRSTHGSPAVPNVTANPPVAAPIASSPSEAVNPPASDESTGYAVKAPIIGTVMQLQVAIGDIVELNQVLLVMEAMKMETNIASPVAGRVKAIYVSPGQAVKAGEVLVQLE